MQIPNLDLDFWNSDPKIHFLAKFGSKKSKLSVFPENWHAWHLGNADSYCNISFINFQPKIHFCRIWTKKVNVLQFGWKLAHRVSRRCWFLFRYYFFQFATLNPFLNKFGPKNSKLFILTKNWDTWYIEDADCYSVFWIANLKSIYGKNLGWKSESCLFF